MMCNSATPYSELAGVADVESPVSHVLLINIPGANISASDEQVKGSIHCSCSGAVPRRRSSDLQSSIGGLNEMKGQQLPDDERLTGETRATAFSRSVTICCRSVRLMLHNATEVNGKLAELRRRLHHSREADDVI
jgi:hypothetical protein